MDLDFNTLAVNLGIAGTVIALVLVVVYRIAILLIRNWRETEKERTAELGVGLTSIADRVQSHSVADLESHAELSDRVSRFEGKLDQVIRLRDRNRNKPTSPIGQPLRSVDDDDNT